MPEHTSVSAKIFAGLKVHITALHDDFSKQQPVYALNWFDTRWLWLYNLYNVLATPSVLKVSGVPFFKARIDRTLYGEIEDRRAVLLIVRYPGIESFKSMLESRYFQLMSLLRGFAVKEFTFGLSTRVDVTDTAEFDVQASVISDGVFAIHHYREACPGEGHVIEKARIIARESGVNLGFASTVSARLYPQQADKAPSSVDTIMTGCLIFQAGSQSKIERMLEMPSYETLISSTTSSYIATLNRIF